MLLLLAVSYQACNLAVRVPRDTCQFGGTLNIRDAYQKSLQREGHVEDPAQLEVIARFEDLQARLLAHRPARRGIGALFGRRATAPAYAACTCGVVSAAARPS